MAKEEEQHGCILNACRAIIENYEDEKVDPSITLQKADEFKEWLLAYLNRGKGSIGVDEAFRTALEIETSEIDAIYGRLLQLGGPKIAKTMESRRSSQRAAAKTQVCPAPVLFRLRSSPGSRRTLTASRKFKPAILTLAPIA